MSIHLHLQGDAELHVVAAGRTGIDHGPNVQAHFAAVPKATAEGRPGVRMLVINADRSFVAFAMTMREFISAADAFKARYADVLGMEMPTENQLRETLPFRVGLACIMAQTAKAKVPKDQLATFIGEVALTVIETGKIPT